MISSGNLTLVPDASAFQNTHVPQQDFGLSESKVRVMQTYIGGGLAERGERHNLYPIAAQLSLKTSRPVKMTYTREEEFKTDHIVKLLLSP